MKNFQEKKNRTEQTAAGRRRNVNETVREAEMAKTGS